MKLYVGNLSYATTEDKLKEAFSNYAEVASVSIMKDKFTEQSKGFGFVEIEDEIKAERAIGGMNGKEIDGRRIRVSEAVEKTQKRSGGARKFFKRDGEGAERSERRERPAAENGGFKRERRERKSEEY